VTVHANAEHVVAVAERLGLAVEVRSFSAGTRTAHDAARAVGTDIDRIVKSLVFLQDAAADRPVLALVPGGRRLDVAKLAAACGVERVVQADAHSVRAATGHPIGGVPPLGHPGPLPTFVDRRLLDEDEVWAAAGTPRDVFAVDPVALVEAIGARIADLT
jgi:prolyl-tRNA editing enzyme YbaK/EbsC (Cys-tRNA(Pro) deacylase)